MGKYEKWLVREDRNKERTLLLIANELAEANRLKRLEFQNYYCKDYRHSINPEKLEDQA